MDEELVRLKSRAMALSSTLGELKERLEKGRIDEGRYADLRTDLDAERISILSELGNLIKDKDGDLYEVTQLAIEKDEEIVRENLVKVAEKKKWGTEFINKIKEHKGTIMSLIAEGIMKVI